MPYIYRTEFFGEDGETVLEAVSLEMPSDLDIGKQGHTANAFDLGAVDYRIVRDLACRACGCTEFRACAGGCGWLPGTDLCTRCALAQAPAELRAGGGR
jgi:hypothetical protein